MQRLEDTTPLDDPENYENPYEKGSFPAISLDRAMGETVEVVAVNLAKICLPLSPQLEEKLRATNEIYDALKAKASQEKRER